MFNVLKNVLQTTYQAASQFKKNIAGYISLSIIGPAVNIITPYLLMKTFAGASLSIGSTSLWLVAGYGTTWAVGRIIPIIRNKLLIPISSQVSGDLTKKIVEKYYELPLDYQLTESTDEVGQLITRSHYTILKLIPSLLGKIIPTAIEISTVSVTLIVLFDAPIGLGLFGTLTMYTISSIVGAKQAAKSFESQLKIGFDFIKSYQMSLSNYENVHYFGNAHYEANKVYNDSRLYEHALDNTNQLVENTSLRHTIICGMGLGGILVLCAYKASIGSLASSDFIMLSIYLGQVFTSLDQFSGAINDFQGAAGDLNEIFAFTHKKSEVADIPRAPDLKLTRENALIEFRNVTFSQGNKTILNNVSFVIPPGKKVAIIGLSGAGKSSLVKLLFRFYNVNSGQIFINGQDISQITLRSLRASIAVVPQDPVLSNKSIKENIKYGNLQASDDLFNFAIANSGLEHWVKENADTLVGGQGKKISGGQRQRIAIARALIKQSSILVFDEATSALDNVTEAEVQQCLDKISKEYTTLVVTHKLAATVNAYNIICIDEGKIVDEGTYEQLIKRQGPFDKSFKTYQAQLGFSVQQVGTSAGTAALPSFEPGVLSGGSALTYTYDSKSKIDAKPTQASTPAVRVSVQSVTVAGEASYKTPLLTGQAINYNT